MESPNEVFPVTVYPRGQSKLSQWWVLEDCRQVLVEASVRCAWTALRQQRHV